MGSCPDTDIDPNFENLFNNQSFEVGDQFFYLHDRNE